MNKEETIINVPKKVVMDMTSGNPAKLLLKFALPMFIGNIFQQFYNMVDAIVVGKFVGPDALASVGATGALNFFIISLLFGLSSGVSIIISQYFGAKDFEKVKKSFATVTYTIISVSILTAIVGTVFARPMLKFLNTPDSIIDNSVIYMQITFAGILGLALFNGMSAVLRALGDSISPLIFLMISSVLNVILDLVFVIYFNMGVKGVAMATVISQAVAGIGCVIYAFKKVELLRIPLKEFKIDIEILKKSLKLGIPVAIQNVLVSISTMSIQSIVNGYGETVIASFTAANRIDQLMLQPGMSMGTAVAAYTGQNVGAARIDRVKAGLKDAIKITLIFSLIMLPVIYFGGKNIMYLFTKKEDIEVVRIGVEAIRVTCFFYIFVGLIFVTRSFLTGAGDVKIPMMMGFTEILGRVLFANVLSFYFGYYGIWWATGLTWVITSAVGCLRIISGKWKDKSILA